jgi:hypothetical protein
MTDDNSAVLETNAVLRRLLGPAGLEISCEQCFELLDQYVELQLGDAPADRAIPGMLAHLEGCSACREEHDSLLALLVSDSQA